MNNNLLNKFKYFFKSLCCSFYSLTIDEKYNYNQENHWDNNNYQDNNYQDNIDNQDIDFFTNNNKFFYENNIDKKKSVANKYQYFTKEIYSIYNNQNIYIKNIYFHFFYLLMIILSIFFILGLVYKI